VEWVGSGYRRILVYRWRKVGFASVGFGGGDCDGGGVSMSLNFEVLRGGEIRWIS
jgi:hypothetical protein